MPGGFAGPGGGFGDDRSSTGTTTNKPPPGRAKPPGNLVQAENPTPAVYSWGIPLIKRRDYKKFNISISDFEFLSFSLLDAGLAEIWPEHHIPREQIHIMTAGYV